MLSPNLTQTIHSQPNNSCFMSLNINNYTITITKAHIKESLDSLFEIVCEGYIQSLEKNIFHPSNAQTPNLIPNSLVNNLCSFSITNPYPQESNTLDFSNNNNALVPKTYKGIITKAVYLGEGNNASLQAKDSVFTLSSSNSANPNNTLDSLHSTTSLHFNHFFSFSISSTLQRLNLTKTNKLYTNYSVLEVIKHILFSYRDSLQKEIDFSGITQSYPTEELITQYNESDLVFLLRIAHNNGIYFYEDEGNIYFYDNPYIYTSNAYSPSNTSGNAINSNSNKRLIVFNPNASNNALHTPCISGFNKANDLQPQIFSTNAFNPSNPIASSSIASIRINEDSISKHNSIHTIHSYQSTHSFSESNNINISNTFNKGKTLLNNAIVYAQSNIYNLCLRQRIGIEYQDITTKDNSLSSLGNDFNIIAIEQTLIDTTTLALIGSPNSINNIANNIIHNDANTNTTYIKTYSNTLTLIPSHIEFIPSPLPKPTPPSLTQGVVIGASYERANNFYEANKSLQQEANTLYTDEFNRIKVRINAFVNVQDYNTNGDSTNSKSFLDSTDSTNSIESKDTNSIESKDTNSNNSLLSHSAFLRVLSPIASQSSGFYAIPRVGDEVLIAYLDNDIDKPIVTGSLYNQFSQPLHNNPNKSSFSARSINTSNSPSLEEGINELTLYNTKDREQVYLKAQKDYKEHINNNFTQTIDNNKESSIAGSFRESINKTHIQNIALAKNVNIGGEYLTNVALSKDTQVGLSNTLNIGVSNKLRVAKDSSEYIGGDKEVEVGGDLNTSVQQDETREIRGNKVEVVGGKIELHSNKGINYITEEHFVLQTNNYIDLSTQESFSIQTSKQYSEKGESKFSEFESNCEIQAGNQILHQVGDTQILAKGDSVIIKAGGVEVVIDSNGLVVKGGEVKSE